ncbi:MAG: acetolactate synthase small subunit [Oscillospiraceae bacterium]|nr:acetolactate synthase small subunit [Oscillospiraceae bacterium]
MKQYIVAVLVRNQAGVLNRVTSMFRRRQFNIDMLTVCETESPDYSRITIRFHGDPRLKQQIIDQLYKLPIVCSIQELKPDTAVCRELLLVKVANDPSTRSDILAAVEAYEAKSVDYTRDSIVIQLTGDTGRIDAFINLMRDYKILEICRTGVVALERGSGTIRQDANS